MIDEIRVILQENGVAYSEDNGWLWIKPECKDGFETGCSEDDRYAYVSCSGWHEEFEDKDEAKNCFLNALTPRVRILVTARGGYEYKWEYQALNNEIWHGYGVTGLLVFPFWRKVEQTAKSNNVLLQANKCN